MLGSSRCEAQHRAQTMLTSLAQRPLQPPHSWRSGISASLNHNLKLSTSIPLSLLFTCTLISYTGSLLLVSWKRSQTCLHVGVLAHSGQLSPGLRVRTGMCMSAVHTEWHPRRAVTHATTCTSPGCPCWLGPTGHEARNAWVPATRMQGDDWGTVALKRGNP